MTQDEEIKRQNEKIEFLARTNMLYSDWEHRETQVISDLIRKGIEEAKINAELRAEIERLKEVSWGVDWGKAGDIPCVSIVKRLPNGGIEVMAVEYGPQRTWVSLTDEDYQELHLQMGPTYFYQDYGRAIEAKLKEKNT